MTRDNHEVLCELCEKRKPIYNCVFCGGNFCEKCIIETSSGEIYCKSCQLTAVKSNQACD